MDNAPRPAPPIAAPAPRLPRPEIDLRQLLRLTDDTGMIQHAVYATPDANHGYCIDDNARALIAALRYTQLRGHDEAAVSIHRYLAFLFYAFNDETRSFRNFMAYDRSWLEDVGSHDSRGRTLWALGLTVALAPTDNIRDLADELYRKSLDDMRRLAHLRSHAFVTLGTDAYLAAEPGHAASHDLLRHAAGTLIDRWTRDASDGWPWWDETVTYDNGKLPHALLRAGLALGEDAMLDAGLKALRWLVDQQTERDADGRPYLAIIGNDGWLQRDKPRADFDQQPLEAYALVDACLDAARVSAVRGNQEAARRWEADAALAFAWFNGGNSLKEPLFDPTTGGCRDGLNPEGANRNQGAESSLAYLLSVLELHRYTTESPAV